MRITIRRGPRRLAAAALAALGLAGQAEAQYAPYPPPQTQYSAAAPSYAPAQPAYSGYGVQTQTPPQYAAQGAYQGYAAAQQTAFTQPPATYSNPYAAPRTAMAFQGPTPAVGPEGMPPVAGGEMLPLTPPVETLPAGAPQNGGYVPIQPTPSPENYGYGPNPTPTPVYGGGYESYPAAGYPAAGGAGCATGNCGPGYAPSGYGGYGGYGTGGNVTPYGACDTYSTYGGMGGCLNKHAGCGYWFGGVYGLLMDRDNSNKYALAYVTDPSMPTAYPPTAANVVMTTRNADIGFQPGVEFRLGRAFGGGVDPCDPCGGCGPMWGLEAAYWTLFDGSDSASYVNPTGTSRTYTMMPMYGLEYHGGSGPMPVNEYWDHGMPSMPANDIRVAEVRVRSSLDVQNLELNLLRFNLCGGGFGGGFGPGMGAGVGFGAGPGCDAGYGACAPCAPCGPRYFCTAVCGFRWMRFDEDFMFGVNFQDTSAMPPTLGFLDYRAEVENNLFGAQIGCNGMYRIGCKWGLHLNTLVGLYGNDIDVRQYMVSPTGDVRYIGTGEDFDVQASKTDVAMLGELRLGVSYQCTCRCRLYGGWRAIGVTGIALATDQTPNAFLSAAQMANYVNSNGSMILHGLQTGLEFNY